MSSDVTKKIEALVGGENSKIQKGGNETVKIDRRQFNKRPPNSGRKPKAANMIARGIKEWLDVHVNEKAEVKLMDRKTGKTITVEKPRIVIVMQKLYELGVRGDGDADALNKWLDRALGKPMQQIGGDADKPLVLKIDF